MTPTEEDPLLEDALDAAAVAADAGPPGAFDLGEPDDDDTELDGPDFCDEMDATDRNESEVPLLSLDNPVDDLE